MDKKVGGNLEPFDERWSFESFLKTTAHDIGNSLFVVMGYAELLARSRDIPSDDAEALREASRHSLRLIDETMKQGALDGDPSANVGAVLRGIARHGRRLFPGCRVTTHCGEGTLAARCSEVQLERALLNVTLNALEATGEGGEVSVTARRVRRSSTVLIEVCDDGPGFDLDVVAGRSTKGAHRGFGLGSVESFVRNAGGHLSLGRSHMGGARVSIYLPAGAISGLREEEEDLPCLWGSNVLVCSGDGAVDEALARLLMELGAEATIVSSPGDLLLAAEDPELCVDFLICTSRTEWIEAPRLVRRFRSLQPHAVVFLRADAVVPPPPAPDYEVICEPLSLYEVARQIAAHQGGSRTRIAVGG